MSGRGRFGALGRLGVGEGTESVETIDGTPTAFDQHDRDCDWCAAASRIACRSCTGTRSTDRRHRRSNCFLPRPTPDSCWPMRPRRCASRFDRAARRRHLPRSCPRSRRCHVAMLEPDCPESTASRATPSCRLRRMARALLAHRRWQTHRLDREHRRTRRRSGIEHVGVPCERPASVSIRTMSVGHVVHSHRRRGGRRRPGTHQPVDVPRHAMELRRRDRRRIRPRGRELRIHRPADGDPPDRDGRRSGMAIEFGSRWGVQLIDTEATSVIGNAFNARCAPSTSTTEHRPWSPATLPSGDGGCVVQRGGIGL